LQTTNKLCWTTDGISSQLDLTKQTTANKSYKPLLY
jgi:hypothetical protein